MSFASTLFACATGLMLATAHAADPPQQKVSFTITDRLAGTQVDEEIAVSVNHLPVGVLKVGADKIESVLTVTVPAATTYQYDLCGHLNQREGDKVVTHKIDNGGMLDDPGGHSIAAMNSDATVFYLVDESAPLGFLFTHPFTALHSCANTVAMR